MVNMLGVGRYKARYLKELEQKTRLEKQFVSHLEYMGRTLSHVSAAAQGLDENLDQSIISMREKMRGGSGAQVLEQMQLVQQAAVDFDNKRASEAARAIQSISSLVDNMLEIQASGPIEGKLKDFSESLQQKLKVYRNYPSVICELSALLDDMHRAQANSEAVVPAKEEPPANDERHAEVFAFEAEGIDGDVHGVLRRLIDKIEPNEAIEEKLGKVRTHLNGDINWQSVSVILEDVQDLLMQHYLAADRGYSDYLKCIDDEFGSAAQILKLVIKQQNLHYRSAQLLSDTVTSKLQAIEESLASASDLTQLKSELSEHFSVLDQANESYRKSQSYTQALTDELCALQGRIGFLRSKAKEQNQALQGQRARRLSDGLTSLPNRDSYYENIQQEWLRFKRYCRPLSVAVCDVDAFKSVNISYGHHAGDKALRLIAKVISTRLRNVDFIARYSGEKFVIIMPETTDEQAFAVLEKIRQLLSNTPFKFKDSPINITVSFGIAEFDIEDEQAEPLSRAEAALARAKENGRNQCVVADRKTRAQESVAVS